MQVKNQCNPKWILSNPLDRTSTENLNSHKNFCKKLQNPSFFNLRPSFADSSESIWNDYIWLNWFEMFTFDWIGLKGLHLIELIWKFQISNWDVDIWLNWRQIIPSLQTAAGEGSTIQGIKTSWDWRRLEFGNIVKFDKVKYVLKVWHDLLFGGKARHPSWWGGNIGLICINMMWGAVRILVVNFNICMAGMSSKT